MEKEILWEPPKKRVEESNLVRFMESYDLKFDNYQDLHKWSIENLSDFWTYVWDFVDIKYSQPYTQVIDDPLKMPGAQWFKGAELNYAENLFRSRDDKTAIIALKESGSPRNITYSEMYKEVAKIAHYLKDIGVERGDRVAAYMSNVPEAIFAMLASASIGAIWTACSPDLGVQAALDRFEQVRPKVMFATDRYMARGEWEENNENVRQIKKQLPELKHVIMVPYVQAAQVGQDHHWVSYSECLNNDAEEIEFAQLPFDHPLYIMYSSGTTGLPKCIVQGAGGLLLNYKKEHILHCDLKSSDTIFFNTSVAWMMHPWLCAALSSKITIVIRDGHPLSPDPEVLWRMIDSENITIFGTSGPYLNGLARKKISPKESCNLSSLRTILYTGAPLYPKGFKHVYSNVKKDVHLASISGGTDINGCFLSGNPFDPVRVGMTQGPCLGMDVDVFNEQGESVIGEKGELVCKQASPSMPLYFWNDEDGQKYHNAYFNHFQYSNFPTIWRHGDFVDQSADGFMIYGRSDATINRNGVRIGTAEIERPLYNYQQIADSVVVERYLEDKSQILMFVQMEEDEELTMSLIGELKAVIGNEISRDHVPDLILETKAIPYTGSGKKMEIAVKNAINGDEVKNKAAASNPESFEFYEDFFKNVV